MDVILNSYSDGFISWYGAKQQYEIQVAVCTFCQSIYVNIQVFMIDKKIIKDAQVNY